MKYVGVVAAALLVAGCGEAALGPHAAVEPQHPAVEVGKGAEASAHCEPARPDAEGYDAPEVVAAFETTLEDLLGLA